MEPRQGAEDRRELLRLSRTSLGARETQKRRPKVRRRNRGSSCNPEVSRQPTNNTHTNTHTQLLLCPFILPLVTARCSSHYRELGRATRPGAIASRTLRRTWGGKISQVHCGQGRERGGGMSWNRSGNLLWFFFSAIYSTRGRTRTGLLRVSPSSRQRSSAIFVASSAATLPLMIPGWRYRTNDRLPLTLYFNKRLKKKKNLCGPEMTVILS